jgi:hypothetical protein
MHQEAGSWVSCHPQRTKRRSEIKKWFSRNAENERVTIKSTEQNRTGESRDT